MVESSLIIGGDRSHIMSYPIISSFNHYILAVSPLYQHDQNGWLISLSTFNGDILSKPYPIPNLLQKNTQIQSNLHILNDTIRMGIYIYTLWLFNIAMENGPFIDGLPGFTY